MWKKKFYHSKESTHKHNFLIAFQNNNYLGQPL